MPKKSNKSKPPTNQQMIDWLEKNKAGLNYPSGANPNTNFPHVWIGQFPHVQHFHGESYREAIINAMNGYVK